MNRLLRWSLVGTATALLGGVALLVAANGVADLFWDPQSAVVQAVIAVWLVAFPLFAVLAGGRRSSPAVTRLLAKVADLQADVERKDARIAALEDHLIYHDECQHLGRFADDVPLLPDLGDRPDWAEINRKPDPTPAPGTSLPAAVPHP